MSDKNDPVCCTYCGKIMRRKNSIRFGRFCLCPECMSAINSHEDEEEEVEITYAPA